MLRKFASNLVDAQPLPTGHYLQEEAPDSVIQHFLKIFHGVNGEAAVSAHASAPI